MKNRLLNYYLHQLNYENIPTFLEKYLITPSLLRLKSIGYFCGMDYASKDIYNFAEQISRYDHCLTVSLLTYNLTQNKTDTIAGLFHDIATPCFSHVIDYMNKDYINQESTEKYTSEILKNDKYFIELIKEDDIKLDDIINFKKHSIVDNKRPKLCADRLDGVILTGIGWTKNIEEKDIKSIVKDIRIFTNEDNELEIGFNDKKTAEKVVKINNSIDIFCHSKEDTYMMELLAKITKLAIEYEYIKYNDLYNTTEIDLFKKLENIKNYDLINYLDEFKNIKKEEIPNIDLPKIKKRTLNPIVNRKRLN